MAKSHHRDGKTQLKIWLDVSEKHALKARAEEAGFPTVTDYIRARCIEAKPRRRRKGPDVKALHRINGQLGKLGGNVNQVATVANDTGRVPELRILRQMHDRLYETTGHIIRALGYGS